MNSYYNILQQVFLSEKEVKTMKLNAKLLVIAMIFAMIFSVSAVAAVNENVTELSSEFTQVPHEQVASVVEPTVQEFGATDLETSDLNSYQEISSISSDKLNNDYNSLSDDIDKIGKNSNENILSVSQDDTLSTYSDESVLGAIINAGDYSGNSFRTIDGMINDAQEGDIIDLQGRTYWGQDLTIYKKITLANGVLQSNLNYGSYAFRNCILENLTINNLNTRGGTGINYCTLNNVHFNNCYSDDSCTFAIRYSNLENVNFTNCHCVKSADPAEKDFEHGVMIVTYLSKFNNCNFANCSSNRHSGAICVAGQPGNAVDITNCNFDNCSSGVGGAVYLHGTGLSETLHSNIINCTFTNCHATEWGGALGSSQDYLNVENCDFINNTAKQGAAFMVGGITHGLDGDNSEGNYNTMKKCYFYNNTGSEEGGAVHITGHNNTAIDCLFDDNFAINGKGAAIYVEGDHGSVINSKFTNHNSEMGTVYVQGDYFNCTHSSFESNYASYGGAGIYVEGNYTYIYDSEFKNNNASRHGGAIHTIGDHAKILNSKFKDNHAIPSSDNLDYGLGGAIFINGNNNEISYSNFQYNTARNGSAIYNRGDDLHLNDDTFSNNQAWSYLLITEAKPSEDYWSEDLEFLINVTLVGGDNLINAIYNDWHNPTPHGVVDEIFFHNVTFTHKPNALYPTGTRTTTDDEIHPVLGVENSQGGRVLYQDSHEDNQIINVNVTYGNNKVFELTDTTDMHGSVLISLKKENLTEGQFRPGVYTVYASHPDDDIYTEIHNSTRFTVLPHVDVSVTKTSDKDVYIRGENAKFTITVTGVGTNATNVTVRDILPASLKYVRSTATKGGYNSTTDEWYIGFLPHGATETLTLIVKTTELGTFDNVVIVNCTERDWNLSNNRDNKTIHVDIYYTKEANVTNVSAGENVEYYLTVYNNGNTLYNETIRIIDDIQEGIQFIDGYDLVGANLVDYIDYGSQKIWEITNIAPGTHAIITVKAKALKDGLWNNTMRVWNYPPVNVTVNVTHNADLRIIKTVSEAHIKKGDIINWTLTVINYGPSDAANVVVIDVLPYGLEQYGTAIVPSGTDFYRENGTWVIGTLNAKDSIQLIIPTRVTISGINITNEANVTSTTPDPNPNNNYDNETVEFYPDVSIQKIVSTKKTSHGEIISWTLVVTNHGPHTATGVYVIDQLPSGLRYANSKADKGQDYNPVSGRWYIGDLAENETVTLQINTTVTAFDGFISNNATVYATDDSNPENNYAENFTEVITQADVGIVKLVSNQTSHYGDEIEWTIIVTNHGPNTAENVCVVDFLPNADLIQTREPYRSKGTISHLGQNGLWTIGSLANGENATLIVYTKVLSSNKTIINVVVVNTTTYDPNPENDRAENGTVVPPECDVEVIKHVNNLTPEKGDTVTWTITVINHGRDVAENVVVTDVLPAGLEYLTNTVPTIGSYSHNRNEWTIGVLKVNERHNLTITTRVVDTGDITNEVNVTTSTYDINLENNYDNETIRVPAIADLEIIKLVSDKNPKYGDLINWTIIVHNKGPNNARNVYVIDKLPQGLVYVNDTTGGEKYNPINGRWDIGDLMHFDTVSLIITTRVNIVNATIVNVAVVNSSTPDNDTTNNKANNTTHVDDAFADLEVIKLVSSKTSHKGDIITWTIIVTNHGPDIARNVKVHDKLPAGLTYRNHTLEHGLYDPSQGIWDLGDLAKGDTYKLFINTIVEINNGTITNIAVGNSTTPDNNTENNKGNNTTTVNDVADLEVIKIVSDKNPRKGDTITWTITVINHGPSDAKNVRVTDKLPEGLIFKGSNGNYDKDTGLWIVGDLAKGESRSLLITTLVDVENKTITNIANVTSDTPDSNKTNNEANNTTTVEEELPADLEVIKVVSNKNPHKGDTITWTITVINHGPGKAHGVTVTDYLPEGLKFVSSNGNYNKNTGVWTIGDLANGESKTLVIKTIVTVTNAEITNVAVVNSTTPDNNTDNNEDNDTTKVDPEADLKIIKTVSNPKPSKGEVITWTIVVVNLGPDAAKDVVVSEELPDGLKLLAAKGSNGKYENGVWTIGTLNNGEIATLTITTKVLISDATIENIVVVNSSTYDPNKTNNKDKEVVKPKSNSTDDDEEDKVIPNPNGDENTDHPSGAPEYSSNKAPKTMHATGNPVIMILLALLAVAGVSLRRRS